MAFAKIEINSSSWTKIVDNQTAGSFQNIGQWPVMIAFTATDTAPSNNAVGKVYTAYQGETKATFTDLTYEATPTYVWAKPISGGISYVIAETA